MDARAFDRLTEASNAKITAKVILDSKAPNGARLTTMEWTYPRCIHSEIMTHRQFSKNSASSRAIPMQKQIARVKECMFFPLHWGRNQSGMQAAVELTQEEKLVAGEEWCAACRSAVTSATRLMELDVHKQIGNRIIEPYSWITIVISSTRWANLFALRCHPAAEPHFQLLAGRVRDAYNASTPVQRRWGEWHLPYIQPGEELSDPVAVSCGRCARVSYLTHDQQRDPEADVLLYNRLRTSKPMHATPFEHAALCWSDAPDFANYDAGWLQHRKQLQDECAR